MRRSRRTVALGFASLAAAATCLAESAPPRPPAPPPGHLRFEPYTLRPAAGGRPIAAELGRLTVLEDRSRPEGATIELAFLRLKTRASRPEPPVVWLAGGPGGSGIEDAEGPILSLFEAITEFSDVIALDQRGMGRSRPRLECPGRFQLPFDRPMDREIVLAAFRQSAALCREHWAARGVDLAAYNTSESARDVDDLRKALGAPKISLIAGSYGTHLALATIRLFESSVARAVLFGVQGPDHMERMPADYQRVLDDVDRMVRRTPLLAARMPSFLGVVATVLKRLDRSPERLPAVDPVDGRPGTIVLGKFDLQCYTRNLLGSREQIARLPGLYLAMMAGDFRELATSSINGRRSPSPPAVDFTMRCASGASPARRERARAQGGETLLGYATDFPLPDVCDAWGTPDLGAEFRAPISSSVPVMLVSGTLDAYTPPGNAKEVLAGFPNGSHVLVDGAGHALLGFSLPKGRKIAAKFLRGTAVTTARLSTPLFGFRVPGIGPAALISADSRRGRLGMRPMSSADPLR